MIHKMFLSALEVSSLESNAGKEEGGVGMGG